jgi:hypothetical protein
MNQFLLLLVGFVLTTVFGGLLGYLFQNRTWDHQNHVTEAAAHRDAAFAVFEELSTLMDKRLYRMRVFDTALASPTATDQEIESAREDYRQVRYEWNDNLNRNLARVEAYFGSTVRTSIEFGVYEQFSELHHLLNENLERRAKDGEVSGLADKLDRASLVIYQANLSMLETIRGERPPSDPATTEDDGGPASPVITARPPSQRP